MTLKVCGSLISLLGSWAYSYVELRESGKFGDDFGPHFPARLNTSRRCLLCYFLPTATLALFLTNQFLVLHLAGHKHAVVKGTNLLNEFYDVNNNDWSSIDALQPKEIVYMHMVSRFDDRNTSDSSFSSKQSRNNNLYSSQRNSSILILTGEGVAEKILLTLGAGAKVPRDTFERSFYVRQAHFRPLLRWFDHENDLEYFLQPVIDELPFKYRNKTEPRAWCAGKEWPFEYAFWAGGVVSYHSFQLRLLHKFDFIWRVDLDIRYTKPIPPMINVAQQCEFVHTHLYTAGNCERNATHAFQSFLRVHGDDLSQNADLRKISELSSQWHFKFPYGNFYGWSTIFFSDPDVVDLANFLYEEYPEGYYEYRWGDQPSAFLLLAYRMKQLDPWQSPRVCDWSHLRRDKIFIHDSKFKLDPHFE